MTTNEQLRSLPLADGHLLVESIGNEVRFWVVINAGTKIRRIGASHVIPGGFGRKSERCLSLDIPGQTATCTPAPQLTVARIYNGKGNRKAGAALALTVLPSAPVVHLFYAGHGPSGRYSPLGEDTGRYSFTAEEIKG